jgi:signal transduction histidine kinase/CheY-like chemotaxis protein
LVHSAATIVHTIDRLEHPGESRLRAAEAEIARLRELLAESREEQQRAVERTDTFLNILAGELRNPLAPMTHALQILRQRGPHAPEVHWAREVIAHQMQQMDRMIEDLVDLSLMTNGGVKLQREEVPLIELVDRAVASMRAYLERYNHNLTVTLPPARVTLDVDPRRMIHVIGHLLSNAAKFTNAGGTIQVSATMENGVVVLSVRDSGVGIAPERLGTLFQSYRGVDPQSRTEGGLGIGLSIVRCLVELHGGSVEAVSPGLGLGSEFRLTLPLVVPDRSSAAIAGDLEPRRSCILVVDDNQLAADSLTMLLQEAGNECATAYDGPSGVKKAEEMRPDVIVLDLSMPGQSGHETCSLIRSQPWGRDIFIVAVTGWGLAAMRDQSAASGVDAHLVKPVHPDKVMRMIDDHRKRRRA